MHGTKICILFYIDGFYIPGCLSPGSYKLELFYFFINPTYLLTYLLHGAESFLRS